MIRYAVVDGEGYVTAAGSGLTSPPGAIALPEWLAPIEAVKCRVVEGEFVALTQIAIPTPTADGDETVVIYPAVPAGTVCEVSDLGLSLPLATVAEAEGVLEIRLIDPGSYRLELRPPRSHRPHTWEITL